VLDYSPATERLELVAVDICGFSRGAAAARFCIWRVLNENGGLKALLTAQRWDVGTVEVRASGLFDTVASHGVVHRNDVRSLHLDAVREARAVLQLAASEEYRANFSLTNIESAGARGRQVFLPGAHSDIGGGYTDGSDERKVLIRGADSGDIADFLLARGWYRGTHAGPELELVSEFVGDVPQQWVAVRRGPISNRYSFIPLRLMAEFLREQGIAVKATVEQLYDPGVTPVRARVEGYARSVRTSAHTTWERAEPGLAALRHGYLHVSFASGIAHYVRIVNVGSWWRRQARPERLVYDG
jgi:hypothetical protein